MPRRVVAGNWKMYKTQAETRAFFDAFLPLAEQIRSDIVVIVAPPFTSLHVAHAALRNHSRVALGAQNVHWELQGAFTGEISVPMLQDFGVRYVIVGHSERRTYFNELDHTVNLKVKTLLAHGITPIIAVGETLAEREAGQAEARVVAQTIAALDGLDAQQCGNVVIAYEPIWAIGTGRNCDAVEANRIMGLIRNAVPGLEDISILYGGSVKPDNIRDYAAQEHINGGLVGGASLDPHGFAELIERALHD